MRELIVLTCVAIIFFAAALLMERTVRSFFIPFLRYGFFYHKA